MKKYLANTLLAILITISTVGMQSCSDDGYSLGDFALSWATVMDDNGKSFKLDDGTTLWVATQTNYVPRNKRVIINYTLLNDSFQGYDHAIKLNGYIADVLTKNIVYLDRNQVIENQGVLVDSEPIEIEKIWEGGNYLNLNVKIKTASSQSKHTLDMLASPTYEWAADGSKIINLYLKHKTEPEGQTSGYLVSSYVAFDLKSLREASASDSETLILRVTSQELDGNIVSRDIKYKLPGSIASEVNSVDPS